MSHLFCKIICTSILFVGGASISQNITSEVYLDDIPKQFKDQAALFPKFCVIKGSDSLRQIGLTFDDGPSHFSNKIIDILGKYHAKATFFWLGSNLSEHPEVVKRAIEEGHTMANHSWDHANLGNHSIKRFWKEQVKKTNTAFRKLTDHRVQYFRPPFGNISDRQIAFLKNKGIKTILWTFSSNDWDRTKNSCDQVTRTVMSKLQPGAIILFHDFDAEDNKDAGSNRNGMLMALDKILEEGTLLGFEFVSMEKLLSHDPNK
ncbi:polysaccharide deacetylase family protein [Aestuariivivens sediminis]|uniref:polysaccharide deacetylase family protein n=1 Tax=Aestuariivivens sediminis TaxID=2913557 RepID=UPI001F55FF73|nr:polysaccharide deacetylase family protein [Aestuariivivens sediminis]